jgi:hypothetical protein
VAPRDRIGDTGDRQALGERRVERRGVEEGMRHGAAEDAAQDEVLEEPGGPARERDRVGPEDLLHAELRPEVGQRMRRGRKVAAAAGDRRSVDAPAEAPVTIANGGGPARKAGISPIRLRTPA